MRILFVSDAASIHTRRWIEAFRDRGCEVHVASFRRFDMPGTTLHQLPTFGLGKLGYLAAIPYLSRLDNKLKPDIVHAQYVTSYGFLAAAANMHPLVITAWGTDILIAPQRSRLLRRFAAYALSRADAITTVSRHMNAAVTALGISPEEVVATPFGVDTLKFSVPQTPRSETPPLRLICTRNFAPIYDVQTLLIALRDVATSGLSLQVELVGEGPLRRELEAMVERFAMGSWVKFHGHVDHVRLAELLGRAHLFVSPALSDGNNISLNEAMACGCFPIATDIPANSQWIENGRNGILYPIRDSAGLADAILRAAADISWRKRALAVNREIVETRADWNVCVSKMAEIYTQAIRCAEKRS